MRVLCSLRTHTGPAWLALTPEVASVRCPNGRSMDHQDRHYGELPIGLAVPSQLCPPVARNQCPAVTWRRPVFTSRPHPVLPGQGHHLPMPLFAQYQHRAMPTAKRCKWDRGCRGFNPVWRLVGVGEEGLASEVQDHACVAQSCAEILCLGPAM